MTRYKEIQVKKSSKRLFSPGKKPALMSPRQKQIDDDWEDLDFDEGQHEVEFESTPYFARTTTQLADSVLYKKTKQMMNESNVCQDLLYQA